VNEEQPQPQAGEPSEEELRAAFEEQMRRISVQDVLLQTVVTLVNLTGRRLTVEEEKDLEQARLGIDAVRALLPLCPEEQVAPVKDALSQLQMLFAREAQGGPPPPPGEPGEPGEQGEQGEQPDQPGEDDAERAKARSKIWTPPGT
jgi:hypothetical protein